MDTFIVVGLELFFVGVLVYILYRVFNSKK